MTEIVDQSKRGIDIILSEMKENALWNSIRTTAQRDPELLELLNHVKFYWYMKYGKDNCDKNIASV